MPIPVARPPVRKLDSVKIIRIIIIIASKIGLIHPVYPSTPNLISRLICLVDIILLAVVVDVNRMVGDLFDIIITLNPRD